MKKILAMLAMLAAAASVNATTYTDSAGDIDPGISNGGGSLDILSVDVYNDATTVYFAITAAQNPINSPVDWGNFMVGIDSAAGGDTAATGNGWARPINMPSGMDYWIGSWVNGGGGGQVWTYTGASWSGPANFAPTVGATLILPVPLASLGLSVGNSFNFDVYTSGGGGTDSAVDALSVGTVAITSWNGPFSTTSPLSYTVVPEPSTMALIAIAGGLLAARRMRRS